MVKQQKNIIVGGITSDGTVLNNEEWRREQTKKKISREKNLKEISRANNVEIR
jgi:hypothetical protein